MLDCGFVIACYSSVPATENSIKLKRAPSFRQLGKDLSQSRSGPHPKTPHVGFLLDKLALKLDDSERFLLTYQYLSHINISFSYHQSHNIKLSPNKTTLLFSVQEFESIPVCVGSNNYNNSNKAFIFNSFLVCGCKVLDEFRKNCMRMYYVYA